MLTLADWKRLGDFFKDNIEEVNKFIYGAADTDIERKIKQLSLSDFPVLLGIMPSSNSTSRNRDDRGYDDICFFYVLEKIKDRTFLEEDTVWSVTQTGIQQIEALILDNYETEALFRQVDTQSFHYDPEYGIWNCMGYSMGFVVNNS